MRRLIAASMLLGLCLLPASALAATTSWGTVSGPCGSQFVAVDYFIEFTPTGGNFANGTGMATVAITIANSSGLYQTGNLGNPVLTGFYFNLPVTANATLVDAIVLAGSTITGSSNPGGCTPVASNTSRKTWYDLEEFSSAGHFGIFANSLATSRGIKGGIVDSAVLLGCTPQGPVFSPLYIAGEVRFVLNLTNLDFTLDAAEDFRKHCSVAHGDHQLSAFAAKFQGTGYGGEGSCRAADPGICQAVSTASASWGHVKALYR